MAVTKLPAKEAGSTPPPVPPDTPRPVGLGKGLAHIPDSFFAPLPEEILDSFESRQT